MPTSTVRHHRLSGAWDFQAQSVCNCINCIKLNDNTMKIKVTSNKLPGALALANGKCTAHTARISDFHGSALRAEMELQDLKLPKNKRIGAGFVFESGRKMPSSYKYRRIITRARLVRGAREWFVTEISTVEVWPSVGGGSLLILTQSQADCAIAEFKQKFRVQS